MNTVKIQLHAHCEKTADGKLRIIATDETLDRSGESVPFESWDLTNFLKSPRLLIDHDYSVAAIVGKAENIEKNAQLRAIVFEPLFHDITAAARETKEMVVQDFLDTVSVGFQRKQDEKGNVVNELMEISFVAVPANPNARMLSVKEIDQKEEEAVKGFLDGISLKPEPEVTDENIIPDSFKTIDIDEDKEQKQIESKDEKGMIEDVLASHSEMMEKKYQYIDQLCMAWCSFLDAYFLDSVPVEDVATLVKEMSDKMVEISSKPPVEMPMEPMFMMSLLKMLERKGFSLIEKSGRVLSEKNRGIIGTAKDAMSSGIAALDDLLQATQPSQGDEEEESKQIPDPLKSKGRIPRVPSQTDSYLKFIELRKVTRAVITGLSEGLQNAKF